MARARDHRRTPKLAVLVAALVAFLVGAVFVTPVAPNKRRGVSIEAARAATTQAVKPTARKAERGPGTTPALRPLAPLPAYLAVRAAPPSPASRTPPAKARVELMVFLI